MKPRAVGDLFLSHCRDLTRDKVRDCVKDGIWDSVCNSVFTPIQVRDEVLVQVAQYLGYSIVKAGRH
jgi:hypothetical protein